MTPVVEVFVAGLATAIATGLGVIPPYLLGDGHRRVDAALTGVAAGVMTVASVLGLLEPALRRGSTASVALGLALGAAFVLTTRRALQARQERSSTATRPGRLAATLTFVVLLAHSLPEGFAIGTAYAAQAGGIGLFVIIAIGIQNVPEGTAVAIPMERAGYGFWFQFLAAITTSLPQPVGAVVAYLAVEHVSGLLPASFGFAAGAMLVLVAIELLPDALAGGSAKAGVAGLLAGGAAMALLSLALQV